MITPRTRLQLAAFGVLSVGAVSYVATEYAGLGTAWHGSYTVHADLAESGGIFIGAEVDERGIRVGKVGALHPRPGGVLADLVLDRDTRIPASSTATVTDRSALGEQYVALTPPGEAGPFLHDGSLIPRARTSTPVSTERLLAHLDQLTRSLPRAALATNLRELGTAFAGTGPDLARLLVSSSELSRTALDDLGMTVQLLDAGSTVLHTQVRSAEAIDRFSSGLAGLTSAVRRLDPTFVQTFGRGIETAGQVTSLLSDTQGALPVLLDNLLTLNDITAKRLPALRKVLVIYPYVVEDGLTAARYCDDIDPRTGRFVASTCHYDPVTHEPLWSVHFALQLPSTKPPYNPCSKGYERTRRYLPNLQPADGKGPREALDAKANRAAICTAGPSDPNSPNVRGGQHAYDDPLTGNVLSPDGSTALTMRNRALPGPADGLTWLLWPMEER